jgi:MYXO-CTERM domain-containing protein
VTVRTPRRRQAGQFAAQRRRGGHVDLAGESNDGVGLAPCDLERKPRHHWSVPFRRWNQPRDRRVTMASGWMLNHVYLDGANPRDATALACSVLDRVSIACDATSHTSQFDRRRAPRARTACRGRTRHSRGRAPPKRTILRRGPWTASWRNARHRGFHHPPARVRLASSSSEAVREERTLRRAIASAGLAAVLSMGIGTAAVAQTSVSEAAQAQESDDDGDSGRLGLIGLLGLAGLAGLARRNRDDRGGRDHR